MKGFPHHSVGKESACNAGDPSSILGLGISPGGRHGNPLQYSCLKNPMDRGASQATVDRVAESDTTEAAISSSRFQTCLGPSGQDHPNNQGHNGSPSRSCASGKGIWNPSWQQLVHPVTQTGAGQGQRVDLMQRTNDQRDL